ncbi:hypothetical protein PCL_09410 [Purpureocillium lilacinum]|uniref:Uncharacterized protein n=1 Tax=Purpureocillium lilacinum TaxID=33203 RepID=A0A2U3EHZ6_PURLI|nr:hypothetical protein PCL_09410 [Purpureocillium lilacinum]
MHAHTRHHCSLPPSSAVVVAELRQGRPRARPRKRENPPSPFAPSNGEAVARPHIAYRTRATLRCAARDWAAVASAPDLGSSTKMPQRPRAPRRQNHGGGGSDGGRSTRRNHATRRGGGSKSSTKLVPPGWWLAGLAWFRWRPRRALRRIPTLTPGGVESWPKLEGEPRACGNTFRLGLHRLIVS